MKRIESGLYAGRRIRTARKAGHCQYNMGGGKRCGVPINAGDQYMDGEQSPYIAGGFAVERWCLKHSHEPALGFLGSKTETAK